MIRNKKKYRKQKIRENRNKAKLYSKNNFFIFSIIIIMIIIGIIVIVEGLNYKKNIQPIYSYKVEKSDNYEVILKPNNFYLEKTLPANRYYVSNSINSFFINFKYDYKGSKKADIEYKYNIVADLVGTVKNVDDINKEVWNRPFILRQSQENTEMGINQFTINEPININYQYYNNLSHSFEENYGIAINFALKVYLNVFYNINLANAEPQVIEDNIELDIPITNTVTEVKENYQNIVNQDIFPNLDNTKHIQIIYYIVGGIFIILAIVIGIIKIIYISKKTPEETYINKINHILNYYGNLIVTITNKPNLANLKIMNTTIFDDLIDVAEQNQKNIIHYEVLENVESRFYVIVGEYVFMYILKAD